MFIFFFSQFAVVLLKIFECFFICKKFIDPFFFFFALFLEGNHLFFNILEFVQIFIEGNILNFRFLVLTSQFHNFTIQISIQTLVGFKFEFHILMLIPFLQNIFIILFPFTTLSQNLLIFIFSILFFLFDSNQGKFHRF